MSKLRSGEEAKSSGTSGGEPASARARKSRGASPTDHAQADKIERTVIGESEPQGVEVEEQLPGETEEEAPTDNVGQAKLRLGGTWGTKERKRREEQRTQGIGARLNDMDISRATEQVAIIVSCIMGGYQGAWPPDMEKGKRAARVIQAGTVRLMATRSLFGYMWDAYCKGHIVNPAPSVEEEDGASQKNLKKLWKRFPTPFGYLKDRDPEQHFVLDFVVSPVDGARDLVHGYDAGAISVLCGGPRGSFPTAGEKPSGPSQHYFVVALRPGLKNPIDFFGNSLGRRSPERPIDAVLHNPGKRSVFKWLRHKVGRRASQVTVATLELDQPRSFRALLSRQFRSRTFRGSSVAAAISVFWPHFGIDAFMGVVGHPHVILLAAAARATGGALCAFPVNWKRRGHDFADVKVKGKTPVYDDTHFVKDQDVFLVASGITEHLILEGVRFREPNMVSTQSLILRSKTKSTRFVSHFHDLRQKEFWILGRCKRSDEIIDELTREIRK